MIDAIIYIESFTDFATNLMAVAPDLLAKNQDGSITQPPVVVGIARTPAKINGESMLAYCRFTDDEAEQWRGLAHCEVLAETPFTGEGTAKTLYDTVFSNTDAKAKYDAVYPTTPYLVDDGEGGQIQVTPPSWFGVIGGA